METPIIDIKFKTYSDANGGDPDSTSPTLKKYHKILWNKELPNGTKFRNLRTNYLSKNE